MCRSDIPVTVIIVDYPPSGCITADTLGKAFTGGKCNRLLVNSEIEAGGRKELAPKKFCSNQTVKRIGHSIFLYKILFVELIQQGNDRRAVPRSEERRVGKECRSRRGTARGSKRKVQDTDSDVRR